MAEKQELRCVIAAGGTAGHVLPALAVAEELQRRGVRVSFAGSPDRVEARLVPEAGYEFDAFRSSGFPRQAGVALVRALVTAAGAPAACLRILRCRQPNVVLGAGGYVSGPMVLAAALQRTPAALPEALRDRVSRPDYRLLPFTDEIGAAYGAADLALARAGGSVWELAAAGLPAVLVPYPHATADHQTKNARHLKAAGGAVVVPEAELDRVPPLVDELLSDAPRRERMRRAMLEVARPDAAAEIADELVALASACRPPHL